MVDDTLARDGSGSSRRPFLLAPLRGLRFDPSTVGDLGTVVSPPYDVLDADIVRDLEAANRRNIVRLILSRRFERPYLAVRKRLQSWRDKDYLCADGTPSLYLYEYTADGTTVRGLIGLVALRGEEERVVLPHEDVMSGPVADRALLMRTTETNLEPILLVHEGSDRLRQALDRIAHSTPAAAFRALDGSEHTLWRATGQAAAGIAAELAPTQALIADGHHRYAAYLRLQTELRDPDAPLDTDPWDFGLAMLVDQADYPLRVGPIHRSVTALTVADVADIAEDQGDDFVLLPDREAAFAARAEEDVERKHAAFVISDGRSWALLRTARTSPIDAAVLHQTLLPLWQVNEGQVGYHHRLEQALHSIGERPGIVVAVEPPSLREVMETAARGIRLPRKSTSFSPKPRMGVVMRDLRDA